MTLNIVISPCRVSTEMFLYFIVSALRGLPDEYDDFTLYTLGIKLLTMVLYSVSDLKGLWVLYYPFLTSKFKMFHYVCDCMYSCACAVVLKYNHDMVTLLMDIYGLHWLPCLTSCLYPPVC